MTLALELGADVAIDSRTEDSKATKEALTAANDGRKVDVILDMAGGATFDGGLAALAPFGRIVTYGMAGRKPASPVDPAALMGRSRAVVGFWMVHCATVPGMLDDAMNDLIESVVLGDLRAIVGGSYPLADARRAHEDIRGRGTSGKLVLIP